MSTVRFLTGITTSGTPHLGNYVGSIRPAVRASLTPGVESFYFLADYHALIKVDEPARIQRTRAENLHDIRMPVHIAALMPDRQMRERMGRLEGKLLGNREFHKTSHAAPVRPREPVKNKDALAKRSAEEHVTPPVL